MIKARSSVVNVPPGRYKISEVLRANGIHKINPERTRPHKGHKVLQMTSSAIRRRERAEARRRRIAQARLSESYLDAANLLDPNECCELWNRPGS
jgi:hypothetical protein